MVIKQPGIVGEASGCFHAAQHYGILLVTYIHNGHQAGINVAGVERIIISKAVVDITQLIVFAYVNGIVRVDIEVVWDTVQNDLPGLSRMLESIVGEEG